MKFRDFCLDYHITTAPIGHPHNRQGWVNIECPFCTGHAGYHLGYPATGNSWLCNCYRCGKHSLVEVVQAFTHLDVHETKELIDSYGGVSKQAIKQKKKWRTDTNCKMPYGLQDVKENGFAYLEQRGFDPEKIIKQFGLKQTGLIGPLRHRLFIPIMFHNYLVSYTCRGIAGQDTRYITCKSTEETVPSKEILYNIDNAKRDFVVVVEGCTDVWRLGNNAVATFGTQFTNNQVDLLRKFKRVFLLRDSDNAGLQAWKNLYKQLSGIKRRIMKLDKVGDASELSQVDADYIMRCLEKELL